VTFEWDSRKENANLKKHGVDFTEARYAHRGERIRIIGAGYWRKGKRIYEKENR
jgi:uncharacterized DUF497 family protein